MKHSIHICTFVVVLLLLPTGVARSQACPDPSRGGTLQDYQRAVKIRSTFNKLAFKTRVEPHWIADSPRFWYRNETRRGKEFILVDAEKGTRGPAFDHARLAEALSQASGQSFTAEKLPFDDIEFIEQGAAIRFNGRLRRSYVCSGWFHQVRSAPDRRLTAENPRLRETDAATGKTRTITEERCETGVDPLTSYVHYLEDTNEGPPLRGNQIIWSSQRDGWCHLYLYDWKTGELKNQITKGDWVVRGIDRVDEQTRQIYFFASGREAGRDPYLCHLYKINFDGTGLFLLTPGHGEHSVTFSPCGRYIVDTYSRVDFAPVTELRRSSDGQLICELEKADIELLLAEGWKWPQPFQAKAGDDKTDIYGVLFRPMNFDPSNSPSQPTPPNRLRRPGADVASAKSAKYPVVECIYSGPQSFSTPKAFRAYYNAQSVAELGFLVIMVDGLGMGGRSKAFHDYSYKNLGDGGLPDHIAAMRQLAENIRIWICHAWASTEAPQADMMRLMRCLRIRSFTK
jgi:dipeptidyl aminopeptidase/acylaminoacyl peptidase